MTQYTRQDALRIMHLDPRQLGAWERAGLLPVFSPGEAAYTFEHLARMRSLREMWGRRGSTRHLLASMDAMQRHAGVQNALAETSAVRHGSGVAFRHGGALVNPVTRQLAFDFAVSEELRVVNAPSRSTQGRDLEGNPASELHELFVRGVQLEESAATLSEAISIYEDLLQRRPDHAPACINLGTIFYNQRDFQRAEEFYRRATEADPRYALAFFDLGNVLDEMQRLPEAIAAYTRAITLVPEYADAHYNLALALEREGERRRALRHWSVYVRLDPIGPWSAHARAQARKILAMERLAIVSRRGHRVRALSR